MRAALVCAGLLAHATASDAKCARVELAPAVLTPAKATLPDEIECGVASVSRICAIAPGATLGAEITTSKGEAGRTAA